MEANDEGGNRIPCAQLQKENTFQDLLYILEQFNTMKIMESAGNMAISCCETACQFSVGQFFIRMLDRSIGIVEKTAEWSLPSGETISEENGKSFKNMELVRPLPWILFLPGLIILRSFRFTWNVGAFVLGYSEMHPGDIVRSLQNVRQRLRIIRLNGIKRMRKIRPANSRDQSMGLNEAKRSLLRSIQLTLSTLSCFDASQMKSSPPPMRIRVPMNYDTAPPLDEKLTTESTTMTQQCETKRKYSQVSSDDPMSDEESESDEMSFHTKLSHYALLNSSNDPDFEGLNSTVETDDYIQSDGSSESDEGEKCDKAEVDKLIDEAQDILNYKNPNSEISPAVIIETVDTKSSLTEKITARNGNGNCVKKNSDDIQDFYSPCKSIEDTDTAFYSPISSNSTTPEREITYDNAVGVVHGSTNKGISSPEFRSIIPKKVAEINHDETNKHIIEKKNDEPSVNSLLPGVKGKQQRENIKGKRNTHGNRKKKL